MNRNEMQFVSICLLLTFASLVKSDDFTELELIKESIEESNLLEIAPVRNFSEFLRPHFTHVEDEYPIQMKQLFGGWHHILDEVWSNIACHIDWTKERRFLSRHQVKMRDGVLLDTIVIRPFLLRHQKRTAMLSRSPYGPTSDQMASLFIALNGFVAVLQDQRGTFESGGKFMMWRNDSNDGYDTMEWISHQDWSNGQVLSVGASADGCAALTQIIDKPKWLRGMFIQIATGDAYKSLYQGGAFRESLVGGWMGAMSIMTHGWSFSHTLPDILDHEQLSSWYDTVREKSELYKFVDYPIVSFTGWWDIFHGQQMEVWNQLVNNSDPSVREKHVLIVGPAGHCALSVPVHPFSSPFSMKEVARGWINAFGVSSEIFGGQGSFFRKRLKRINIFVQGPAYHDGRPKHKTIGNFWSSMNSFPKPTIQSLFLSKGSELVLEDTQKVENGHVSYLFDPKHPKPTAGGNNLFLIFTEARCGPMDQTQVEARDDVVVFTSKKPLNQAMAITGNITAELFVSSDREDTDFFVSLNDLYPNGKNIQVRYGLIRMRWRDRANQREPMVPGKVYKVLISMWPTSYIFNEGHHFRVSISSSSSPYFETNSNEYQQLPHEHARYNSVIANNTVHFSKEYPSRVMLPVVSLDDLEENTSF